ncbi:hypothetical protein RE474_04930 [Methanolobus sediminis]|uniref:Uncharacterized protein n=1 Tax=Methanolobus sediminis TaxID=3072978 RepID=A0AA51YMI8_9EURY|nr:hypothetical protein [Methanolobus sediminis]WMW26069.1 hypothetical protein RE474_04930 [Methanolobus sediminis]
MKKLPLIVLGILILMVLISGLSSRDRHPDNGDHSKMTSSQPEYINNELYGDVPSSVSEEKVKQQNEKDFLADNIQKSDETILRLEDSIDRLASEGNDVSDLEKMVMDYSSLVSDASSYLEKADSADSVSDEQKYVALSKDKMVQSDILLKKIFMSMHNYMPGPVKITENDSLDANGSGVIVLSGDLDVDLSLSSGKFSVVDFEGDMSIDTDGLLSSNIITEGAVSASATEEPHHMLSYSDVQGNVSLSGSGMTIAVMGDNTTLHVTGVGEIQLYGDGSYYLDNSSAVKEGVWLSPIFEAL